MGYPMTYKRVVERNTLDGDYLPLDLDRAPEDGACGLIAGDLRRLETDQRDDKHIAAYAALSGVDVQRVKAILDLFFEGFPSGSGV